MNSTYVERPKRTNAPMQPRNEEGKMQLIECQTCGSHSFTNGKCDYCGNQYEYNNSDDWVEDCEPLIFPEMDDISDADLFVKSETGQKISRVLIYILISVIWFGFTVFIPPLFLITIVILIILAIRKIIKKLKLNA